MIASIIDILQRDKFTLSEDNKPRAPHKWYTYQLFFMCFILQKE